MAKKQKGSPFRLTLIEGQWTLTAGTRTYITVRALDARTDEGQWTRTLRVHSIQLTEEEKQRFLTTIQQHYV